MRALRRTSGGGAGLVFGLDFHDAVASGSANEFLDAPTRLSVDTLPVVTGPGDQPSCLPVVVGAGMVHTTTSRRARRWARGTVPPGAGVGSVAGLAILGSVVGRCYR
jgi:hypothetical protein